MDEEEAKKKEEEVKTKEEADKLLADELGKMNEEEQYNEVKARKNKEEAVAHNDRVKLQRVTKK